MFIRSFPDEIDLLAFFEGEPIFQSAKDLNFTYTYTDENEMFLTFRLVQLKVGYKQL